MGLFESDGDKTQRELVEASNYRDRQAAYISKTESEPLRDLSRGRVHRSRDGDAAYVSRREAKPFRYNVQSLITPQKETHRAKVIRLTFCSDCTRFPGEPKIDILPRYRAPLLPTTTRKKAVKRDLLEHMAPKRGGKKLNVFDLGDPFRRLL